MLPPNQGIQGKLGSFVFIQEESGGIVIFQKVREIQGIFTFQIILFQRNYFPHAQPRVHLSAKVTTFCSIVYHSFVCSGYEAKTVL